MLIDGTWAFGDGAERELHDPSTAKVFATYRGASPKQVAAALEGAKWGFVSWSILPPITRTKILLDAAEILRGQISRLAATLTLEQGKPIAEATAEWKASIETLVWYANEGLRTYGRLVPARQQGVQQAVSREPVGPVAAFAPWNFPALTPIRKIAAALAAGCSCVIKPAEETPLCTLEIGRALISAGLPPGVLNIVYGDAPAIATQLIESPVIQKVSFTGSTAIGRKLAALAGAHVKPLTLELGGHAPVVIFPDADLDLAIRQAGSGKFKNAGQICVAPTRFIVHDDVYELFVERLVAYASSLHVGNGADPAVQLGPLANMRRVQQMADLVEDARASGARVSTGKLPRVSSGYFWPATVLHDLSPEARILREEPFGPLAPCVRFSDFETAVSIANGVAFGLSAYAFTRSLELAHRAANALKAGMVGINTCRVSLPELPFGGVADSGYGREGGNEGLEPYLITKSISMAYAPNPTDGVNMRVVSQPLPY
ncbi:NAD-dependent succinate-semialdehyde dehydrogenase [Burkholderia aenigmatica]|uniref:NAD-dependent succinate-semialdehyde dehydrogenase n=1 Tax=Burkholderia aenigmatica TaxID=2015348 RepID=UPI003B437B75